MHHCSSTRTIFAAALAVGAIAMGGAACTSSEDSTTPPATDAGGATHPDAAPLTDGGGGSYPPCVTSPHSYLDLINACTDAQAVDKTDDLSVMNLPDGGLRPLP